jgi:hypothetical protein
VDSAGAGVRMGVEEGLGEDMKTCGTCANWQPPKTKHTKSGTCPYFGEEYPEEQCVSWGWRQASKEQLESRERAGLIE